MKIILDSIYEIKVMNSSFGESLRKCFLLTQYCLLYRYIHMCVCILLYIYEIKVVNSLLGHGMPEDVLAMNLRKNCLLGPT